MSDRQWRAFSCRNNQVFFAVEQEGKRVGTFQAGNGLFRRIPRRQALVQERLAEERDSFRVGLGLLHIAFGGQFLAQRFVVFDDPVVDNGDRTRTVRVSV